MQYIKSPKILKTKAFPLSSIDYNSIKEALQHWQYKDFTLRGARKQGGYFELEAEHPDHNNLVARGRTLSAAIEGLERQIDTMYGEK